MKIHQFSILILLLLLQPPNTVAQINSAFSKNDSLKAESYFKNVLYYMNQDNYDSSQYWLDKIDVLTAVKKPTFFTYLFHSRQAEIYYYNNLIDLGIQEINRGLIVAKILNNNALLSDSYNMFGLLYLNNNQLDSAEVSLNTALKYVNDGYYLTNHYDLSQSYHIYGNLAEVLMKQRKFKQAVEATNQSIIFAKKKNKDRAVALGQYTKAETLLQLNDIKKAQVSLQDAINTCLVSKDFTTMRDVYLVCFASDAKCQYRLKNVASAHKKLLEGLNFYKKQQDINRYYSSVFVNDAIAIFENSKDFEHLATFLKIKSEIENQNVKGSLKKIETIINVSLKNERRVLKSELNQAQILKESSIKNKQTWIIIISLILLIMFLLVWINRRLRAKNNELVAKNAEISEALLQGQTIERKRVAADLHDNLGSTLSSIKWSLEAIDKSKMDSIELEVHQNLSVMLESAYNEVRLLSHNLLPEEFEKQGLASALAYFVRRVNQQKKIKFSLDIAENVGRLDKKVEFELYSICLELANNIIKHSKATEAKISLFKITPPLGRNAARAGATVATGLKLVVSDNGQGFFENNSDGKGMKNVQARVDSIGGKWNLQNSYNQGVRSEITIFV